jgi:23S rRNA pseudouridine1911/1915/1917 synthase
MRSCQAVKTHEVMVVSPAEAGERLDSYVAERLGLSRRHVVRLLRRERVTLGGRPAAKGTLLRAGDRLEVLPFRGVAEGPPPDSAVRLTVLAEAHGLVAVDKPAGIPTHPLDLEERGTVLSGLLVERPELVGIGEGGVRSGVVHRLDTGTSGVLVFASEERAWLRARRAFAERRVDKLYLARAHGRLVGEREVSLRLEHRGPRMRVVRSGGREALTRLRPLAHGAGSTLLEVRPVTGLMHQIRVSLAHLGHPVVGDVLYGSSRELGRHLLHATEIRIEDFSARSSPPAVLLDTD